MATQKEFTSVWKADVRFDLSEEEAAEIMSCEDDQYESWVKYLLDFTTKGLFEFKVTYNSERDIYYASLMGLDPKKTFYGLRMRAQADESRHAILALAFKIDRHPPHQWEKPAKATKKLGGIG